MKFGGITLVGGILFGVTVGVIALALLSALAGVCVTSAAGLAASVSVASGNCRLSLVVVVVLLSGSMSS